MNLIPIGIIHSPHQQASGTPVQASLATTQGTVELFPPFVAGLKDLDGFDRIWLMYWFDRAAPAQLVVTPYLDTAPRGLFATRAPCRPNPLGLSCVRLLEVRDNVLRVEGLDILDRTPLLDIKPYLPAFDAFETTRTGWFGRIPREAAVADERFSAGHQRAEPEA